MALRFVLSHGWGFSPAFWAPLLEKWPFTQPPIVWDAGYYGLPDLSLPAADASTQWVGIGHSIGFARLIRQNRSFSALIGLQAFTRFLGDNPPLREQRLAEWEQLSMHFDASAVATLKSFYRRCGVPGKWFAPEQCNRAALKTDLQQLKESLSLPDSVPVLILSSQDDVIVPPAILQDNFQGTSSTIDYCDTARHALGYLEPEWVLERIQTFLKEHHALPG